MKMKSRIGEQYLAIASTVAHVMSYVGNTMSHASLDPHQENIGSGLSSTDFFSSGQSPKLIKKSRSGSLT